LDLAKEKNCGSVVVWLASRRHLGELGDETSATPHHLPSLDVEKNRGPLLLLGSLRLKSSTYPRFGAARFSHLAVND
jgi:hypothetical protein